MFERPRADERVVLVHVDCMVERAHEELDEFKQLVLSAGAVPVATVTGSRNAPTPGLFVGSGKAEEIRACVERERATVVLFNHALTPSQERNLENLLRCRVLDRTSLILDIFAQRARSFEGKLQVELAQLQHLSTRLVRGWTHLERQKGGIGLRGPGETQLETDRRLIRTRIRMLNKRLAKLRQQRQQGRQSRRKAAVPVVSLVGYTNAGKSTLFNRMTGAHVYTADQLFATLDPTLRRLAPPDSGPVVLADTVGFIRHLPHDLVEAFRSTLEETREAELLLHVVDAADEGHVAHMEQVNAVLGEIGADTVRQLEVYNKIDALGIPARAERDAEGRISRVWVSAATGEGMDLLRAAVAEHFRAEMACGWLCLPPCAGRMRARLFDLGAVRGERINERGEWLMDVQLPRRNLDRLCRQEGIVAELDAAPRVTAAAGFQRRTETAA